MNRIIKINFADILYDYRQASSIINKACLRNKKLSVTGVFFLFDNLFVILGINSGIFDREFEYIISPVDADGEAGMLGVVESRYYAGFKTITCFMIQDKLWGVFEKEK